MSSVRVPSQALTSEPDEAPGLDQLRQMDEYIKHMLHSLRHMRERPLQDFEEPSQQSREYSSRMTDLHNFAIRCATTEQILMDAKPVEPEYTQARLKLMGQNCQDVRELSQEQKTILHQWFQEQKPQAQSFLRRWGASDNTGSGSLYSESNSSQVSLNSDFDPRGRERTPPGSKRRPTPSTTRNASQDPGPPAGRPSTYGAVPSQAATWSRPLDGPPKNKGDRFTSERMRRS